MEAKQASRSARTLVVKAEQSSLDLWEPICLKGDPTSSQVLLLLPEGYKLLGSDPAAEIGEARLGFSAVRTKFH